MATVDNRQFYTCLESNCQWQWWRLHSVAVDHYNQKIYVTSSNSRLKWVVPFWSR